jgi:NADH dehydrogenase [ubiquinone] 1 alpha subcomplex assembly factor 7
MTQSRWHERMVTAKDNTLAFALALTPADLASLPKQAPESAVAEISEDALAAIGGIAARLKQQSGAALFIDYGHTQSGFGDTFQAVKAHKFADPLADPGEADLTAHVDFEALAKWAQEMGVLVLGTTAQGAFLESLGIRARALWLKQGAEPAIRAKIAAAVDRLINPAQMGTLFKVMALVSQGARTS